MFRLPYRRYYYGKGQDNIVLMHHKAAAAVNKLIITEIVEAGGFTYCKINLTEEEARWYDIGATMLNKYLKTHVVLCPDDEDVLRPVK